MASSAVLSRTLNLLAACCRLLWLRKYLGSLVPISVFLWFAAELVLWFALICCGLSSSCLAQTETREARELADLAPKVIFLCEFAKFEAPPEMRTYWTALSDPSLDAANLIALLKSPDPKIRSLAIVALDRKDDPHLLGAIAALQTDQAFSYRCPLPVDQWLPPDKPETWPSAPMTVGQIAGEVVHPYLEVSRYTNFSDYWARYEKRNYSVAWLILRLRRAWDPFDPAHPGIDDLRRQVSLLPPPDRQWAVLCLGTVTNPNKVVYPYSEDDMLHAATELGHDALIQLVKGQVQSTDPFFTRPRDTAHYDPYREWLQGMQMFVLVHAKDLLRPSDADVLLQFTSPESIAKNSWESGYWDWWAIAAASLRPERYTAILDEAEKRWPRSPNIPLARWRIQGASSLPSVLRWFYQSYKWEPGVSGPEESLALAIEHDRWNRSYEPLVRAILTSDRRLSIDGPTMYRFAALAREWHADFDSQFVDWIYAQPADAHPELMAPPRRMVVKVSGVARKLVQDDRFLKADAQLLYGIEQCLVGTLNLTHSESVRLDHLILPIDQKNPQNTSEADRAEIRELLRKGVSAR